MKIVSNSRIRKGRKTQDPATLVIRMAKEENKDDWNLHVQVIKNQSSSVNDYQRELHIDHATFEEMEDKLFEVLSEARSYTRLSDGIFKFKIGPGWEYEEVMAQNYLQKGGILSPILKGILPQIEDADSFADKWEFSFDPVEIKTLPLRQALKKQKVQKVLPQKMVVPIGILPKKKTLTQQAIEAQIKGTRVSLPVDKRPAISQKPVPNLTQRDAQLLESLVIKQVQGKLTSDEKKQLTYLKRKLDEANKKDKIIDSLVIKSIQGTITREERKLLEDLSNAKR